jgi:hypothetical protein
MPRYEYYVLRRYVLAPLRWEGNGTGPTRRRLLHPVPARRHEPRAATTKTHDAEQTDDISATTTSTSTSSGSTANEPAEENDGGSGRGLHSPTSQLNLSRFGQGVVDCVQSLTRYKPSIY